MITVMMMAIMEVMMLTEAIMMTRREPWRTVDVFLVFVVPPVADYLVAVGTRQRILQNPQKLKRSIENLVVVTVLSS